MNALMRLCCRAMNSMVQRCCRRMNSASSGLYSVEMVKKRQRQVHESMSGIVDCLPCAAIRRPLPRLI